MIRRGEIYETKKTRPALVVSNDINNEVSETVTVLPITSKTDHVFPFEVFLESNKYGLKEDSKVKTNQIRTVDKKRLGKLIGILDEQRMGKVETALLLHLGID